MTHIPNGGPAFPFDIKQLEGRLVNEGMTLRQYAAINLRVPRSGTDWLDAMILHFMRDHFAGQALTGAVMSGIGHGIKAHEFAEDAYTIADAMIAEKAKS